LVEQAKILVAEAEENNLGNKAIHSRFTRWRQCSLCEQWYHGVVACALGWASWKTYVVRPETDWARRSAMTELGNGLSAAQQHVEALTVKEAELTTLRRVGVPVKQILDAQTNLANTYSTLGRDEEAMCLRRDVYSGHLRLWGEEHRKTLMAAGNYAISLGALERSEEAKALLRKTVPVARRVLGEHNHLTFSLRANYAAALHSDPDATLDDLREAVTTLEETERTARRVLGGAHPATETIEHSLREARAALSARSVCDAAAAMPPPGDA